MFPILSDFFRLLDFSRLSDSTALVKKPSRYKHVPIFYMRSKIFIRPTKNQKCYISHKLQSGLFYTNYCNTIHTLATTPPITMIV